MYLFLIYFILPITHALVIVEIHRNSLYHPLSSCSFIRNASWSNDISIQSCIWECVHEYDCQTAIYFNNGQICSMFKELCQTGYIQSSTNISASVICYRKTHDPIITCSSTVTSNQEAEETTSVSDIITNTETNTIPTTIQTISRLTLVSDPIFGICNTTVGGNSTPSDIAGDYQCNFAPNETPSNAIDNNHLTKYTNFGNGNISISSITNGCYTGFYTTPSVGPSILKAIQFVTGNDYSDRDPIKITIEGTNLTSLLTIGNSWTLIYSGSSGLDNDPGRNILGIKQMFNNNTIAFTSYRLLITTKRASGICVQYFEAILLG